MGRDEDARGDTRIRVNLCADETQEHQLTTPPPGGLIKISVRGVAATRFGRNDDAALPIEL